MKSLPKSSPTVRSASIKSFDSNQSAAESETAGERAARLYRAKGGVLIGWLLDEARVRGLTQNEMATALGVTCSYINQLATGVRQVKDISHDFCVTCARFLGVPPIAIKILSGGVRMSDFLHPTESEDQGIERAIRAIQSDPIIQQAVTVDLNALSFDAKKAVVQMYVQFSNQDVLNLKDLPEIVDWCQRATTLRDSREFEERAGHSDTSAR
jgi:transcriptional regulator with XRE-family HTH domain